jgi:hypothetical protein
MEARTFQYTPRVGVVKGVRNSGDEPVAGGGYAVGTLANLPTVGQRGLLHKERHKLTGDRFYSF